MLDIKIDSSPLKAKLRAAVNAIEVATVRGLSQGTTKLAKDIDDFMFVPLAMKTDISQNDNDTVATLKVSLNLPKRIIPAKKFRRNFNYYKPKQKKPRSARSWKSHVQEQARQSKVVQDAVASEIERALQ